MEKNDGSFGVVANITFSDGTDSGTYVIYCKDSKMKDPKTQDFSLGIFSNYAQLLLISLKNKFQVGSNRIDIPANIASADLIGVVINIEDGKKIDNYISYATLPFIYICNNEIGLNASRDNQNGRGISIYQHDGRSGQNEIFTHTSNIQLDRQNGNFSITGAINNILNINVSTNHVVEISDDFIKEMINKYNNEFIKDGYINGRNMFDMIYEGISDVVGDAFSQSQGGGFGQVLIDIADRWTSMPKTKNNGDFNIGAAVFLRKFSKEYKYDRHYTMMRSLNIKGVNRAAHAEVRMSIVLDFLSAVNVIGVDKVESFAMFPTKWKDRNSVSSLAKNIFECTEKNGEFVLFSSLLPCYMCEGVIESTNDGYIESINNAPVNLWNSFYKLEKTANIYKTAYYDIDSAVNYREIDAFRDEKSTQGTRYMVSAPTYINDYLPNNVNVTYALDTTIPIRSIAVPNAGEQDPKVGLSNDATAARYRISGQLMAACNVAPSIQRVNFR
ncbi:MAG: hypothetical protein PW843_19750 [Azospirillaceae bacterium]|nr:hypothetical protein [Azospirillaceae bacterium]